MEIYASIWFWGQYVVSFEKINHKNEFTSTQLEPPFPCSGDSTHLKLRLDKPGVDSQTLFDVLTSTVD